jgi:hypothetical protein
MMVDGEWIEVEHDDVLGVVRVRHPKLNGGNWLEECSAATAAIKTRHDLYQVVRRIVRATHR